MSSEINPYARDLDLMRDILLWMERGAPRDERPSPGDIKRLYQHISIMKTAGLIDAVVLDAPSARSLMKEVIRAEPTEILPLGYDLLDTIREDTAWNKTKGMLKDHVLPRLLDVITAVITAQLGAS